MVTPRIIPRAEHVISRKVIDPDALKVLNRLKQFNYTAYLVGGSVRDLLLERRPKDFDIGTSAHPYEVKRLFRNCWIIGRRFRLAHVKFGQKTIEVATFRRQVTEAEVEAFEAAAREAAEGDAENGAPPTQVTEAPGFSPAEHAEATGQDARPAGRRSAALPHRDHLLHRDNTFGTPEEDAFRRDFTVNALFYDIATFSIIDYVGGIEDLRARVIRSIGDPEIRFKEDPVRMLRAIVLAARLDFHIDPPTLEAVRTHASEITRSAPARLIEEFYKILRSGAAERAFRELADVGLLKYLAPELLDIPGNAFWDSLAALDRYRQRFDRAPDALTNSILLGTLLVPRGFTGRRPTRMTAMDRPDFSLAGADAGREARESERPSRMRERVEWRDPAATLGVLPLARRDVERLGLVLGLQRRLRELQSSPRAKRALIHRGPFAEALTWLEIHGGAPEVLEHWRGFIEAAPLETTEGEAPAPLRRRRRRRRGGRARSV